MTFRRFALSALVAAAASTGALASGLDAATQARLSAALEEIREADASRRAVLLAPGSQQGDLNRALNDFRDRRRKAVLDAAEALLAVKGSFPKDEWKEIVARIEAAAGLPTAVDQARKELPAVVADPARRGAADKTLADLSAAFKKHGADPASARRKFLSLLEKKNVERDDFVSGMEKITAAQEDLDRKVVDSLGSLRRTLTPAEWDALAERLSAPAGAGAR